MKLTKYEHACFTVEIDSKTLIVDPGVFTKTLGVPKNVVAIIVTHEHSDHYDESILKTILSENPEAVILAPQAVISQLDSSLPCEAVEPSTISSKGPFELEFFGGTHAQIHPNIPLIDNVGVLINSSIYYPGDSFTVPMKPVELLALPVSGPWLKVGEAIDFMLAIKPHRVFPTHGGINSDAGAGMVDNMAGGIAKAAEIEYHPLSEGQSLDI